MRLAFAMLLAAASLPAQSKLIPVNEVSFQKMLAAHKGKVVLVDFWATWCVPCRAEMPELVKLSEKLRARGLDFVSVSTDDPDKEPAALKVLAQNAVPAPFYMKKTDDDGKFYDSIDVKWAGVMPGMFIYDRSGKRVRSFIGETPVKDIEAAIQKLLP
jgi:thiol-disulfide isomerase/thioredoxin